MKKKSWKKIPDGGTIEEPGNSVNYNSGDWRSQHPVLDKKKCIHCLTCFIYCPDSCILVKDKKMVGFDYKHCKGCALCATSCPVKAIAMKKEDED